MAIEAWLIQFSKYLPFAKSDLDVDWREVDYCAIDLETTGLDLHADEIVAIGTAQIHNGRIAAEENFYREVRPMESPSIQSMQVHGLRTSDLDGALLMKEVAPDLVTQISGRVLIAHAAWMERAFLRRHLLSADFPKSKSIIDTAALARAIGYATEGKGHEPSLEYLARRLHLPVYSPHNALGDALTTAVVFLALATELERIELAKGSSKLTLKVLLETSSKHGAH
ncbi:MAG TPA: 3'-5' exonuclease [Candidatus Paceibacterota bacterium]|nr:3'-5' exonuclease [Candidatus Paceibacterota bacterium]